MHEPVGPALLVWLETSGFAQAMRQWLWLYPIVEIVHIGGIVLLVGGAAMFDLRLLGLGRTLSVRRLARLLLPWSVVGLALVAATGLMMFTAHATEFWVNPAFAVKMSLIVLAGLNAALFHRGIYRTVATWDVDLPPPPRARFAAAASLALWLGAISGGRLIAYL
ncbi:MAG TPA: hypothetical protein VIL43_08425 [Burkholderiales bacterium]